MPTFKYSVDEIYKLNVTVEAEDPTEAVSKVQDYLINKGGVSGVTVRLAEDFYYSFNPRQNMH